MNEALAADKQVLLFHNRRGTAPTTLCENCGFVTTCPRCFIPLTLHADSHALKCHICGHSEKPTTTCPQCSEPSVLHRGIGTKLLESETAKLFPDAKIARFDGDNKKGENVHELYDQLKTGKIDIIIGTQTIAKGLDLPNLALVGLPHADAGLAMPDFSASERTFQLIAQACGRVGRTKTPTRVVIQTYRPQAPAVRFGADQDYKSFYNHEIKLRQQGHFPPFSHLLKLTNSYKTEKSAVSSAKKLAQEIAKNPKVKILGPTPAFYERTRDNYHWQIVVRAPSRDELKKISSCILSPRWQLELDPSSLL
jgi:primosomal protein N' (replication factor Y)